MINVILVEEQSIVRRGIMMLLSIDPSFDIVGEVATVNEALEMLSKNGGADLLISDYDLSNSAGLTCLNGIKSEYPKFKLIYLSAVEDEHIVAQALENGASGY